MKRAMMAGGFVVVIFAWAGQARGQAGVFPAELKGKIIANTKPIELPTKSAGFTAKLRKQDKGTFKKNEEGHWQIHFVAFFNKPAPETSLGIVVLDPKKEAVAVAEVAVEKGQRTLAAEISVDSTEFPGKPHLLRVYFARGGKPVALAEKQLVLK